MSDTPTPEPSPVASEIAGQVYRLAERLRSLLGDDYGTDDDEVEVGFVFDPETGESIVAITVEDLTYHEANGELIVQRERAGRLEWARVGDDGEPVEPWEVMAPPPSRAANN